MNALEEKVKKVDQVQSQIELMPHQPSHCVVPPAGLEEDEQQSGDKRDSDAAAVHDGMEGLDTKAARLRFGKDLRLLEVISHLHGLLQPFLCCCCLMSL